MSGAGGAVVGHMGGVFQRAAVLEIGNDAGVARYVWQHTAVSIPAASAGRWIMSKALA